MEHKDDLVGEFAASLWHNHSVQNKAFMILKPVARKGYEAY